MNRLKPPGSFSQLIIVYCLAVLLFHAASLNSEVFNHSITHNSENSGGESINTNHLKRSQKATVFHNRKGLKEEIRIEGPLKELTAVSETKFETINELIEHISIWIPQMYRHYFLVKPRCIIILETKINEEGKSQVRFGVAMECVPVSTGQKTINI